MNDLFANLQGVSIVIPCYKSTGTIETLASEILREFDGIDLFELILVNDGSPDELATRIDNLRNSDSRIRSIELTRNFGQHNALLAGIHNSRFGVVVTMDDDLQHLPSQVILLLEHLLKGGFDVVYGVPLEEEHGLLRSSASVIVKKALTFSGYPNAQSISAFRVFRTDLFKQLPNYSDPNIQLDAVLNWLTSRVGTVKVKMVNRQFGQSNYSISMLIKYAFNLIIGHTVRPLRLVTFFGGFLSLVGLILGLAQTIAFFTLHNSPSGYTSLIVVISFFLGIQMLFLGVMGEYLGRLYIRNSGQPTYVIRD